MSNYQKVIDALQQHDLSWSELDRLELHSDTYEDFQERSSFPTSNYATNDSPAVRETKQEEKIVYVSEGGSLVTIEL
jgi:hypothetical protein